MFVGGRRCSRAFENGEAKPMRPKWLGLTTKHAAINGGWTIHGFNSSTLRTSMPSITSLNFQSVVITSTGGSPVPAISKADLPVVIR
jgi:hypothetical protein